MDQSDPLYEKVVQLHKQGSVIGCEDNTLRLEEPLTRQDLMLLWGWYVGNENVLRDDVPALMDMQMKEFLDYNEVEDKYKSALNQFRSSEDHFKHVFGQAPYLNMAAVVTRGEAALLLVRMDQEESQDKASEAARTAATGSDPALSCGLGNHGGGISCNEARGGKRSCRLCLFMVL
ncbi:hypothetical protein [Xylanibacillus composti]|uniref:hypothetical protein n=1 Tax=Xylanibacillus composti TaxID=1572762 RepID=UPI0028F6D41A|nr:hypothetical protein [Xylanibacillus composti]